MTCRTLRLSYDAVVEIEGPVLGKPVGPLNQLLREGLTVDPDAVAIQSAYRRLTWAEVVAVGPTVRNLEEGDQVLFAPDAGFEVEIRGEEYLILRERDVHAIASTRAEGQSGLYL